ncbi:MAG: minor capsid protein, partial [Spirochaetota bacterium]|nr:minor capsid protein [Spirochaetota bacterium]
MNSPAYDIASMLAADTELGLVLGTNLFRNREPTSPDNVVTIFDYMGHNSLTLDKKTYSYSNVQICVRNR